MDPFITAHSYRCNKILEVLTGTTMSTSGYTSSNKPFFKEDNEFEPFEMGYDTLPEFPEGLNNNIIYMYKIIGHKDREIYFNEWTIMSVSESLKKYEKYCSEGQKDVFDIAHRYMGLGHIEVLACDLSTHHLYTRPDGGSNGYDREFNHDNMIKNGPIKDKQFLFSEWFYE